MGIFFRKVGSWSCGHGHGRTAGTIAGDNAMTLTNHQHCPSLKTQPAGSGRSLRPPRSRRRLRPPDLCYEPSAQAESLLWQGWLLLILCHRWLFSLFSCKVTCISCICTFNTQVVTPAAGTRGSQSRPRLTGTVLENVVAAYSTMNRYRLLKDLR